MAKESEQANRPLEDQNQPPIFFDAPVINEEVYLRVRNTLERKGYTLIVKIDPKSVEELLKEDEKRAALGEERIFEIDAVDQSESMRRNVSSEIEIAINPKKAKIKRSHALHTEDHIRIITQEDALLNANLPPDLQGLVHKVMPTTSIIVQAYKAYKEQTGKSLIEGWFARAADELSSEKGLARVGKYPTDKGMRVRGPDDRKGINDVYAFAIVILPRR